MKTLQRLRGKGWSLRRHIAGGVAAGWLLALFVSGPASAQYPPTDEDLLCDRAVVTAGETVTCEASGFASSSSVRFVLVGSTRHLRTVRTDAGGGVESRLRIPRNTEPGEHEIEARGENPSGNARVLSFDITVEAATEVLAVAQAGGRTPVVAWTATGVAVLALGLLILRWTRTRGSRS